MGVLSLYLNFELGRIMPLFLAFSDVHSPKYLSRFKESVRNLGRFDVIFIAGDLMEEGNFEGLKALLNVIRGLGDLVITVQGNEDYDESLKKALDLRGITWLLDEARVIEASGFRLKVIGSMGVLDRPTRWQERNIPNIREIYKRRFEWICSELESDGDLPAILLTHYAPTYRTLEGEDRRLWPMLGCERLEKCLLRRNAPILAIHGHAHESRRRCVRLGRCIIINVAFPNLWRPVVIRFNGNSFEPDIPCTSEVTSGSILDFLR